MLSAAISGSMSANRFSYRKGPQGADALLGVAEVTALQRGQERSGALRNRDPRSARHFLCTLSRIAKTERVAGGGAPSITVIMRPLKRRLDLIFISFKQTKPTFPKYHMST